jgi:hypothetical protein
MPIIDFYLLAALAAGLVVARSPAARHRAALIVLILMAANYGVRAAAHQRAIDMAPRVFGPLLREPCVGAPRRRPLDRWPRQSTAVEETNPSRHEPDNGRCLLEVAAMPGFLSPLEWRLVAQLSNGYYVRTINLFEPTFEANDRLVPNQWTPVVFRAAAARPAQVFLSFSRFPAVRVSVDHAGTATVQWTDVRFSGGPAPPRPQNDGRGDLFGARVQVMRDGQIQTSQLGGR